MSTISNIKPDQSISLFEQTGKKTTKFEAVKKDSVEISNTAKVFDNVDKFMNLSRLDRTDLRNMNSEEKKEFLKMTADLIQHGIIGYEVLEVNGKPEKHDITLQIGDERLYGAKLYKKNGYYKDGSK
jgi:hypothetical protein